MRWCSRIVSLLLLLPFLSAMFTAQGFASSLMPAEHPAACHEPMPAPAPVSYQCCVMGHHWALPGTTFWGDRLTLHACTVESDDYLSMRLTSLDHEGEFPVSSASPPQAVPLRV